MTPLGALDEQRYRLVFDGYPKWAHREDLWRLFCEMQAVFVASTHNGTWSEAADRHEEAADLSTYPLRHWALADAARCRGSAGETEAAIALFDRLDAAAPELQLPEHVRSLRAELRASP